MLDYIAITAAYIADLYPIIVYAKPPLMDLPAGAIIGTWAYSIPNKARFILDRSLELAPGVLPGDLARAWIRDEYKLPLRKRKEQLDRCFSVPLHAVRGDHGVCSYVDISKAYIQILSLGYDVDYLNGQYLGSQPRSVPPEIISNKFAYSMAVTMSGNKLSSIDVKGKEGVFTKESYNQYSNPSLYNLAQDTLNAIGSEMLSALGKACVYANTDGYIIKQGSEQKAIDLIGSWGFNARIKHQGESTVRGVASWKVGEYTTRRFDSHAYDFTSDLMDQAARTWLKVRWQKFGTKIQAL